MTTTAVVTATAQQHPYINKPKQNHRTRYVHKAPKNQSAKYLRYIKILI